MLNVTHSMYDSCVLYWAKLLRGLLEIHSKGANDRKEFLGEKLFITQSLRFYERILCTDLFSIKANILNLM